MRTTCTHLDLISDVAPRTPEGCEECLASGDRWLHLRLCLTCGHVGCCDSSPNRHATRHFHATDHPIVQSFEANEDWSWCYVDQVILEAEEIAAAVEANAAAATGAERGPPAVGAPGGLMSRLLNFPHRRNYVIGVIDDHDAASAAADALRSAGFPADGVVLQSGAEISGRLDGSDLGNLVREATTEEGSICRDFDEMSAGGAVLSVYTGSDEEVERAARVLSEGGAHSLKHFGDWTISDLPGQRAGPH